MKKLIVLIMVLSLVLLCGCKATIDVDLKETNPNGTKPTGESTNQETTGNANEATDPIDWETPIDIDDSFIEEQPNETNPTEAGTTEPGATEPDPTQAGTTEPAPTEPEAEPTEPALPKPTSPSGSKPIELPMIPG